MIGVLIVSEIKKVQLNVRLPLETIQMLDEIVDFYQENTKIGKVYKGDVLADIIERSHEVMNKQRLNKRPQLL